MEQDRRSRNKPTELQPSFSFYTKTPKMYFGEKRTSTNGVGKTVYPHIED
jgi:hypothetical protein